VSQSTPTARQLTCKRVSVSCSAGYKPEVFKFRALVLWSSSGQITADYPPVAPPDRGTFYRYSCATGSTLTHGFMEVGRDAPVADADGFKVNFGENNEDQPINTVLRAAQPYDPFDQEEEIVVDVRVTVTVAHVP
jgi:hypothetical protein